eukprot:7461751-Ditylum_brightwellii.AAC.1
MDRVSSIEGIIATRKEFLVYSETFLYMFQSCNLGKYREPDHNILVRHILVTITPVNHHDDLSEKEGSLRTCDGDSVRFQE